MSSYNDHHIGWSVAGYGLFIAACLGIPYCIAVNGCENACRLDHAEPNYVIGNGCYCVKDGEAYNPADSR